MPLVIKNYRWTETDERIFINVPLNGVNKENANIFSTNEYVSVSCPPYIFESVLYAEIDDEKSLARLHEGCIVFTLIKKEPGLWKRLNSLQSDDKAFVLTKKKEALEYAQKRNEELAKEKSAIKESNKKYTLREMMKTEEQDRKRIEDIKEYERKKAMDELNQWKEMKRLEAEQEKLLLMNQKIVKSECKITELSDSEDDLPPSKDIFQEKPHEKSSPSVPHIEVKKDVKTQITTSTSNVKNHPTKKEAKKTCGPRQRGNISVKFTPRVFPTPQRESKEAEENEWLQKQAESRKRATIDDPDLAEHEKDPEWLKDKAGRLFAAQNYLAAENAYNLAIRILPKMPILYVNRAACHLKLRNLYKCAEDCSKALEFMVPPVQGNARGRLKAHLRRAAAFCELELYVEALQDYEAALKIEPNNENLKTDAEKIRTVIQSSEG